MKEKTNSEKWMKVAFALSIITIVYNLLEGVFSVYFGASDDTLSLLGFGADSFVEVISGIGIAHMLIRMRNSKVESRDRFERQALRLTGFSFYLLTAGLILGVIFNVVSGKLPSTTTAGIVIALLSIASMYFLMKYKLQAGHKLQSEAILSDAACTKTCLYLSFILLASSTIYEVFRIPYIDLAGSLGIAWFSFSEGREAFEKARSNRLACNCADCH